ncbi:hypothetical protein HPB50_014928 [Hyalomma asiaticum]|uniref:Uncharacterized protein n=1 Tax=Hyalomma asiaticum TaxID=266040 RepID=A0ACB7S9G4_HYAAI|nr:hypothetical protein HPB50_014928 [Hyalomma asiaticum]
MTAVAKNLKKVTENPRDVKKKAIALLEKLNLDKLCTGVRAGVLRAIIYDDDILVPSVVDQPGSVTSSARHKRTSSTPAFFSGRIHSSAGRMLNRFLLFTQPSKPSPKTSNSGSPVPPSAIVLQQLYRTLRSVRLVQNPTLMIWLVG